MKIGRRELESLSCGSEIIGGGGGGNTFPVRSVLNYYLRENHPPVTIGIDDISDSALVMGVAYLGSTMVIEERLPQGRNLISSIKTLENFIGEKTSAIIPIEGAGVNALIPLLASVNSKTPVIDADGMGRAFPELSMTTFSINGISASPLTISDDRGNVVVVEELEEKLTEEMVRGIALIYGGGAWLTAFPMTGAEARKFSIKGTISRNIRIGDVLLENTSPKEKIKKLEREFNVRLVGEGYVKEIFRYREGKFSKGDLFIKCYDDRFLKVSFQNEYLMITEQDEVIASVPTIITLIDAYTLRPIRTDEVTTEDEVLAICIPEPDELRTNKALNKVGPRVFGYKI
jgi:DUF917 family protein